MKNAVVNESHGAKKHNSPKNTLAAMRKGNREADQEMFGGGFRQTKKIHKSPKSEKKSKKIDIYNLDRYDESIVKISENDIRSMVVECVKRVLKETYNTNDVGDMMGAYDGEDDSTNEPDNFEISWGNNIETLIKQLEEKFSEVIAPEEDEYGMSSTPLESLISHLKYYYDHDIFDSTCFNAIYKMLDNYDFTSDEEVMNILKQLKMYC